jgi:N-methylhydantoinase A/oxoprolinase/acetone carboxylase beta subunit
MFIAAIDIGGTFTDLMVFDQLKEINRGNEA